MDSDGEIVNSIRYAGLSDRGRVRENNEDRWFADVEQQVYLVSDGMGGHLAGEVASECVVNILSDQLRRLISSPEKLSASTMADRAAATLAGLSEQILKESKAHSGLSGMGATVVGLIVCGSQAVVLHMGDSRAYLKRAGHLERLTKDHSIIQLLLDDGTLSAAEEAGHPARGQLTRYVGMSGQALPEAKVVDLAAGDRLLLCTDGLTNTVSDERLRAILEEEPNLELACRQMVDAANDLGGQDNTTVLVVAV